MARSVVGGSRTAGLPDMLTTATLYCGGNPLTNSVESCFAASSLLGLTSVASIERDTSITMTIVARSRGTFSTPFGRAHAATSVMRLSSDIATARCRRHCDCRGITAFSTDVFVKRMPVRFFRRVAQMYSSTSSGISAHHHRRSGLRKFSEKNVTS